VSEEESLRVTDWGGRGDLSSGAGPGPSEPPPSDATPNRDRAGGPQPNEIPAGAAPNDLGALFMMFASSALINLGAVPDPQTDERRLDLGQAQAAIDVLLMLRDKTRGNRSEQESRLLEDILYDLQMRFVRAARGPSRSSAS
jgi:hypothetical protein